MTAGPFGSTRYTRQKSAVNDATPPHDLRLERNVLGSLIAKKKPELVVSSGIEPSDFYSEAHSTIWSALQQLAAEGEPIDETEVIGRLSESGALQRVGGDGYVLELTDTIPDLANTKRLLQLARKRRLWHASRVLGFAVLQDDGIEHAFERVQEAQASLLELENGAKAPPLYLTLSEMAALSLRPVGERLSTGFDTLDKALRGGIPGGRVVVLSGAPGAAKTSLAVHMMDRWERAGCAAVFLAADEPAAGILTRLGQLEGFLREALEDDDDASAAVRAGFVTRSEGRSIVVLDPDADATVRTIEDAEKVLLHIAGDRPRVLVVDSLQTAPCAAAERQESLRERIDAKIAVIKAIAKRGTVVLAISEMARSGYRSPTASENTSALAASKESGSIEYGAALLLGLRSVKGESGLIDVEVAKNRLGGSKPELRLRLDFERASFAEIELPKDGQHEVASKQARACKLRAAIIAAVRAQSLVSANDIYKAVKGTKTDVLAEVRDLQAEGSLVQVEGVFRVAVKGVDDAQR